MTTSTKPRKKATLSRARLEARIDTDLDDLITLGGAASDVGDRRWWNRIRTITAR